MIDETQKRNASTPEPSPTEGTTITALTLLPTGTMLDERALAGVLRVSPRTIRRMVERGELPEGVKLGGRKIWISEKVIDYIAAQADRQAAEARKQAERIQKYL